ncbi:MAG: 4-phosphopantoate--beta-alanine ligase [Candidatus Asgardarchaeia archaeon]
MTLIPEDHPRAWSLKIRHKLVEGLKKNIVTESGLIAHGRGEAFDYIIGEKTIPPAEHAIKAAVAKILLASHPVLSVNGNVAALVPKEMIELARVTNAKIEVNIFYRTPGRLEAIAEELRRNGAEEILGIDKDYWTEIPEISSFRRVVDKRGIYSADVVFVPLEDGDRTEALRKIGKEVIAVDLNPLSRTAQWANITIVDNIVRCVPLMIKYAKEMKKYDKDKLEEILRKYSNRETLKSVIAHIKNRLEELSTKGIILDNVPE